MNGFILALNAFNIAISLKPMLIYFPFEIVLFLIKECLIFPLFSVIIVSLNAFPIHYWQNSIHILQSLIILKAFHFLLFVKK